MEVKEKNGICGDVLNGFACGMRYFLNGKNNNTT